MRSAIVASLLLLAACTAKKGPDYVVKLNEQYGHLANGVHVILLPDKSASLVEVDVRYAVGSKEDPPGRAGIAHFVEHLLFLQRQAGPDQPTLGAVLRQHSVFYNAQTTWDFTHYQSLSRAQDVPQVVMLEALRLGTGCETLTAENLAREREVVKNELRMRLGSPEAQEFLKLQQAVYPKGHPYQRPVGGTEAELDAVTLADVCSFVRDYYVPERATLVIAGDFDPAEVQRLIAQHFGPIPARAGGKLVTVPPVKPEKRRTVIEVDGDESSVVVAWPMQPQYSADSYANLFIGGIIEGQASIFNMLYDDAESVDSFVLGGPSAPMLAVRLGLRKASDADDAAGRVLSLSERAHWGLQYADLSYARGAILGQLAADLETLPGRTSTYAGYAQFDPKQNFGTQVERIGDLDGEQVKSVVKRTLGEDKAEVIVLKAKQEKGGGRAVAAHAAATAPETRDELPVDPRDAATPIELPALPTDASMARRFTLDNGMQVVLLKTEAPLPVVTATLSIGVGAGHDPPKQHGLATVAAIMMASGRLLGVRAPYSVDVTPDTTEFTGRTVTLYVEDLFNQLDGLERDVHLSQAELDILRKNMQRLLKHRSVRTEAAMSSALGAALYGADHPYAAAFDPIVAAKLKVSDDTVEDFIKKHYTAANATLVVAGVFDPVAVEKMIREKLGGWKRGSPDTPVTAPSQRPPGPLAVGVAGADDEPLVQVHIAYPAPAGYDAGFAARRVLIEMLDRRVASVRERLGAAYAVNAMYRPTVGPSMFAVAGAVDAARAGEALAAMRGAVDELRRGDGFLEDFVRARAAVVAHLVANANDSRSLAATLTRVATHKLAPEFPDELAHQVAKLSPRDVLALARKELDPQLETIVCEGPRAALTAMFARAKVGAAKIVDASK